MCKSLPWLLCSDRFYDLELETGTHHSLWLYCLGVGSLNTPLSLLTLSWSWKLEHTALTAYVVLVWVFHHSNRNGAETSPASFARCCLKCSSLHLCCSAKILPFNLSLRKISHIQMSEDWEVWERFLSNRVLFYYSSVKFILWLKAELNKVCVMVEKTGWTL